ncbi:hypothetical protein BDZ94DRAFT_1239043 [Collybia nuda]|uniref:Malate dehydrogenase n=1 Tax=Collybia nuda TaxID=64659 RepID=A0A9P5XXX5_9AGAR|nr:hypothetical protein BDZ94DRAFT_1239043 [Collybia nuda]
MLAITLLSLALATVAFALPNEKRSCDVSKAKMSLPSTLISPTATPSFIAVAIGTQNYTCGASGTYTNTGAVAELFDMSCLYNTPLYSKIPDDAYTLWKLAPSFLKAQTVISLLSYTSTPVVLGQHYYVPNPITGTGASPKWDFTSQGAYKGDADAFVVAAKSAGTTAPVGSRDVDWVLLTSIQGSLASEVYRIDTRGGQPPASCTPGSAPIAVKYAAMYWLFGGSVKK